MPPPVTGMLLRVHTFDIDLTDERLAEAPGTGYKILATGVPASGGAIRVVVRDSSTGVAGSLKVPLR